MSDELNPYPGNLKQHKVEPLLSDEDLRGQKRAMGIDEGTGSRYFRPMLAAEVRDFYEAARAKDAELIQMLVDALHAVATLADVDADERATVARPGLEAAAAAGFKPTEPMTREQVNDYITRRLAWDDAVKLSPHRCPNCGEGAQVQIRDTVDEGGPLWKCRICRHLFHTDAPKDVPFPHIEPNP